MDFGLTEEQKGLIALIKDFGKREIEPKADYIRKLKEGQQSNERDRIPWDILKKAQDIGLRQLAVPEKYGGGGAGFLTQFIAGEAIGRYCGELGGMTNPITHLWGHCNEWFATSQEVQDELFTWFMEDHTVMTATAVTEADAGSDAVVPYDENGYGIKTSAYRDGDEWIINGEKGWSTAGAQADILKVVAKIRDGKNGPLTNEKAAFYVRKDTPGFSVIRVSDMMYNDLLSNAVIHFENVKVPERYRAMEMMGLEELLPGIAWFIAPIVGTFITIYEKTKEYAKTRIQGGQPIFEHKNIGTQLSDMWICIEALRHLCYKAAWEGDQFAKYGATANVNAATGLAAWSYCKEIGFRLIEHICEIYGANAIMKDMHVEPFIRETFMIFHGFCTRSLQLVKMMPYV